MQRVGREALNSLGRTPPGVRIPGARPATAGVLPRRSRAGRLSRSGVEKEWPERVSWKQENVVRIHLVCEA
jgi:actin-like ATPase involved in cell morphogenesis